MPPLVVIGAVALLALVGYAGGGGAANRRSPRAAGSATCTPGQPITAPGWRCGAAFPRWRWSQSGRPRSRPSSMRWSLTACRKRHGPCRTTPSAVDERCAQPRRRGAGRFRAADDPEVLAAAERLARLQAIATTLRWRPSRSPRPSSASAGRGGASSPDCAPASRSRRALRALLLLCSTIAIVTTLGIVVSLTFESIRFFAKVPVDEFLFGLKWSAQTAIPRRPGGRVGLLRRGSAVAGTLLITAIAMVVAAPIGLMSAVYLSEYARCAGRARRGEARARSAGRRAYRGLRVLRRHLGRALPARDGGKRSACRGLGKRARRRPRHGRHDCPVRVLAFGTIVINAVPQSLRDGSYALGATRSETVRRWCSPRRCRASSRRSCSPCRGRSARP